MPYIIQMKTKDNRILYVAKDGELKTHIPMGREVYLSGVKIEFSLSKATHFETIQEASRYHSLVGLDGRRGRIVKV